MCLLPSWGRAVGARLTDAARPTTSCRATTMTGPATSTRGVTGCGGAGRCERSKRWRNGWAATAFHISGSPHWCDSEWVRCMGNPLEAYVSSATLSIGDPFLMYESSLEIAWRCSCDIVLQRCIRNSRPRKQQIITVFPSNKERWCHACRWD
jgi:hypothetical protein